MANCGDKIKMNCVKSYAACVDYEKNIPAISILSGDNCTSVEDVISDIYKILEVIKTETNFSNLNSSCVTLTQPKTTISVVTQMLNKICALDVLVNTQAITIQNLQTQITALQQNNCP